MFLWTINSNRTFTDTNPGIIKDYTTIKTIFIIKAGIKDYRCHYQSPEEDHKAWNTWRTQVYEIINPKYQIQIFMWTY